MANEILIKKAHALVELDRRQCEQSYFTFFCRAWNVLEYPNELILNWHVEYLCDELQKEIERISNGIPKEKDLIINIPPRTLKTYLVSIMLQPWAWTKYPWMKFITTSCDLTLSTNACISSRRLIDSDWYQTRWGNKYVLTTDQNTKTLYENDKRGYRKAASVGSNITGSGSDIIVCDDLLNPLEKDSEAELDRVTRYIKETLPTRLNHPTIGMFIYIMQRLHEDDPTGYHLRVNTSQFRHICLPATNRENVKPRELRKRYINGMLFPDRLSMDVLRGFQKSLGTYGYSGQYDQEPSPDVGGMFKKYNWRYWHHENFNAKPVIVYNENNEPISIKSVEIPTKFEDMIDVWDLNFKPGEENDPICGSKWSKLGSRQFLLGARHGHHDFTESCNKIRELKVSNKRTSSVHIENKANGAATLNVLENEISGIREYKRGSESKTAHAAPAAKKVDAHQIYLPHPEMPGYEWVKDWIDEHSKFPKGKNDDRVDNTAFATNILDNKKPVFENYYGERHLFTMNLNSLSKHTKLIISQWVEPNLSCSILIAAWNADLGRLYIFEDIESETTSAEKIINQVEISIRKCFNSEESHINKFEWIGNDEMFNSTSDRYATDAIYSAYDEAGVMVEENPRYNEHGAITTASRFMTKRDVEDKSFLWIHNRCDSLAMQLMSWGFSSTDRPENGYGLCRALCNIVSLCQQNPVSLESERKFKPYTGQREAYSKRIIKEMDKRAEMLTRE